MDLEKLQAALIAADAAGNQADVAILAGELRRAMSQPTPSQSPQDGEISNLSSLGYGLQNGVYFGFDDEIAGLDRVVMDPFNWSGAGDNYRTGRDQMRAESAAAQQANPNFFMGGDIGGSIGTSLAALPAIAGKGILGAMGWATGLGAAEGGLMGAGNADGRDMLPEVMRGGLLGGTLGAAAVPVAAGLRAAGRMVADPLRGIGGLLTGRASQALAARPINRAIYRSGMDIPTIENRIAAANADGQHMFALADALGLPGQRLASGVARQPGEGRTELVNWLNSRQGGQRDRVGGFVADALNAPDTAAQRQASLTAARAAAADVNYPAARADAVPVDVRSALDIIDERLGPMSNVDVAGDSVDAIFARYRSRLAGQTRQGEPAELSDFSRVLGVKQDLQDDITAATIAGRGNQATLLTNLRNSLDAALENSSGGYRRANDTFRQQSQVIDSIDLGREVAAGPRRRVDDATDAFGRLGQYQAFPPVASNRLSITGPDSTGTSVVPYLGDGAAVAPSAPPPSQWSQQDAFRVGFSDPLLGRIENLGPGTNATTEFLGTKNGAMMGLLSRDPEQWQRLLDRENTMFQTRFEALGGSKTADNMGDAGEFIAPNIEVLANIFTGRFGNAAGLLGKRVLTMFTGMNEQTRNAVARALMSQNPVVDLAPLVARGLVDARILRAVETTLRQSGLRATGVTPGLLSAQ